LKAPISLENKETYMTDSATKNKWHIYHLSHSCTLHNNESMSKNILIMGTQSHKINVIY